ncbi:hypothetical protein SLA2020_096030 [Shorea laevis]
MKWKKMFSGQEAWWLMEYTAARSPRTYSESNVIAMCTNDGSHSEAYGLIAGQSFPFRFCGASTNSEALYTPNPNPSRPLTDNLELIDRIPRQNGRITTQKTNNSTNRHRKPIPKNLKNNFQEDVERQIDERLVILWPDLLAPPCSKSQAILLPPFPRGVQR